MLPPNVAVNASFRHDILELARFLTELSVIDYFFVTRRTSSVALAGILNAMELLNLGPFIPEFLAQLQLLNDFDPHADEIDECRFRLKELYLQGGYARGHIAAVAVDVSDTRTDTVSPVCVSAFGRPPQQPKPVVAQDNSSFYHSNIASQVNH